ncbi:MAG: hypothetical protein KGJ93_03195 [Patescibacteria group bacterium]|nr:hypothetical protein [Patescibacteria group bacterium]
MNKQFYAISAAASLVLLAASALPASAMLGSRLDLNATGTVAVQLDTQARIRANTQIQARITKLDAVQVRINQMSRVSTEQKTMLNAAIQAAISDMTNLQAKINADTDNATLKADIQSITKSYRIYVLVLPQANIMAAADRTLNVSGLLNDLSAKLQTRIAAAQTAGQSTASLSASLSEMNAKTADAQVQANAAISEVANLKPDNGDKTVFQSNLSTLKDARAKIRTAMQDLVAARQDAGTVVRALIAMKVQTSGNASSTAQ